MRKQLRVIKKELHRNWAAVLAALFLLLAAALYLTAGDGAQIGIADNLDLFQAQYQILKNTGTFYAQNAEAPFLHGISRDVLPSEFSVEAVLYQLLPSLAAYEVMYFLKVILGLVSFTLLAGELERRGLLQGTGRRAWRRNVQELHAENVSDSVAVTRENHNRADKGRTEDRHAPDSLAVLCGFAYGLLNLFPSFGIAFASVPLLIWMLLRLERAASRRGAAGWLLGIFLYPWVSYFSYFGFFLLCYLLLAVLAACCGAAAAARKRGREEQKAESCGTAKREMPKSRETKSWTGLGERTTARTRAIRLILALLVLSAGYITWEYRLFRDMLLGNETTIRETMVQTSLGGREILQWIGNVLIHGVDMHCESAHCYVVLPVCILYLVILNAGYVRRREWKRIGTDIYNLGVAAIIFNSVIYGLYYCEAFRGLVEQLIPPLTGFQFSRTVFLNPFLWYGLFYVALYRLLGRLREQVDGDARPDEEAGRGKPHVRKAASSFRGCNMRLAERAMWLLPLAAILVILGYNNSYNDLLHTAKAEVKSILGKAPEDSLSYGEFYSTDLFAKACEEIDYQGEWAVAYGFHPAVLEYNGIATLDGYLGFYSQSYKESFREVIAPALEENEGSRIYYDEWGARCYLYSGHNTTIVEAVRNYPHTEDTIEIDTEALKKLGGKYIFSRIQITNATEKGLSLRCVCTDENSPYVVYVYDIADQES